MLLKFFRISYLTIFYCIELFCVFRNAIGEIIVPPIDEEAVVLQNVTLKCQSNIKTQFPVVWYHLRLGISKYNELLYEKGIFYNGNGNGNGKWNGNGNGNGHHMKYGISGNTSDGEFNLVISNVTVMDAGRYTCAEIGRSEKRAELIVYESYQNNLTCFTNEPPDGFIGANDCGITPDTIRLSCSISYHGNLEPELEWKQGNKTIDNATVKRNNSFIMSSIELRADEISSPDFQCRVRYLNSNIESKFIWLTTVHVLDTKTKNYDASCNESQIQSVDCVFTNLHQCSYTWKKDKGDSSFPGSIFNFTSADEVAVYTCHAECLVRDTKCSFTPAQVAYTCDTSDKGDTNIAAIIVLIVVVFATIIVIVVLIKRRHRLLSLCIAQTHRSDATTEAETRELQPESDKV